MITADLHLHPLNHRYYAERSGSLSQVVLDDADKRNIRAVVDWCIHERHLDVIALTDHDMIQASLYAREYVSAADLSITIITGAECEVTDPQARLGVNLIHLLCLGIESLPEYTWNTPVERMVPMVHELGGTVIMSHPIYYPETFFRYCHLLDGYEYRNGHSIPFDEGKKFVQNRMLPIKEYCNSDFHYEGTFPSANSPSLQKNLYLEFGLK